MAFQQSIFKKLCVGVSYNKQRFQKDINQFKNSKLEDEIKNASNLPSLDFFGSEKKKKQNKSKKKEKNDKTKKKKEKEQKNEKEQVIEKKTKEKKKKKEKEKEKEITQEQVDSILVARQIRNKHKINTKGNDIPNAIEHFEDLKGKVSALFLRNTLNAGYKNPTPIQMQSIPSIIQKRDILACAPTGSGKTASFVIPILSNLKRHKKQGIRALVVTPTRELADQTYREFEKIGRGRNFKIVNYKKMTELRGVQQRDVDVLISTPLRVLGSAKKRLLDLSTVQILIFDEVDKLFEIGFLEQIDTLIHFCRNKNLQKLMFSATILPVIEELAFSVLKDPIRIVVGVGNTAANLIDHRLTLVGEEDGKILAIRQMISEGIEPPVLIFVQTKSRAKDLFRELIYDGISVEAIHADRTKLQRDTVINKFREGKIHFLICTDMMSRGLDFLSVKNVINFDFPQTVIRYIHRVGRTGRAGRKGIATTLYTEKDKPYLRQIANVIKLSGSEVPEWMLNLKKPHKRTLNQFRKGAGNRKTIDTRHYTKENARKRKHNNLIKNNQKANNQKNNFNNRRKKYKTFKNKNKKNIVEKQQKYKKKKQPEQK
ncbi:dead-box atp-dependent RNA helicase [Anaeramoeba flamelloides]|uniref:RNA helicase n=1 Tax=Anaeramoeba flamelloides TaxID=1746091 RepID=A0AAV7ZAA8_9EUKA|nr:dead-box atp-dependent RNA helicase [Anaeramoeba flamelloides]